MAVKVRAHLSSRSVVVRTVSAGLLTVAAGAACSALLLPTNQAAPPASVNTNAAILIVRLPGLKFMFIILLPFNACFYVLVY